MKTPKDLINELIASGMRKSAIAKALHVSGALITRLASGYCLDTSYTNGKRLEALVAKISKTKKK